MNPQRIDVHHHFVPQVYGDGKTAVFTGSVCDLLMLSQL